MKKLLEKVKGLLEKFKSKSKKIKIAIIVSIIAVIIAIVSAIFYSSSNKYQVLFSNLDDANLQTVMSTLNNEKVDAKIDKSTNTITVPKRSSGQIKAGIGSKSNNCKHGI